MFAIGQAGEVFVGRAVALVLVFARKHQHFVVFAVVIAARVGQDVVDLDIVGVMHDAVQVQRLLAVSAFALLFFVELEFCKGAPVGLDGIGVVAFKFGAVLFIAFAVLVLCLFNFSAFFQRTR